MPIGQISFMRMDGPVDNAYGSDRTGSKYQGQAEPTPSRFYKNFATTATDPQAGGSRRNSTATMEGAPTRSSHAEHRPA